MDERERQRDEYNGGKFPNRGDSGLALSEFLDSAGVNGERTSVSTPGVTMAPGEDAMPRRRATDFSAANEFPFPRTDYIIASVGALGFIAGWLCSTLARRR